VGDVPEYAVGIGAISGVRADAVSTAVTAALSRAGLTSDAVRAIATIDTKAAEPGLLAALRAWPDAPLRTYPAALLSAVAVPHPSDRVRDAVGSPSVAEAAALTAAAELSGHGTARLVLPKTVTGGVTVAVAQAT
jgi:cobalamin biosynthesis protein CbiG